MTAANVRARGHLAAYDGDVDAVLRLAGEFSVLVVTTGDARMVTVDVAPVGDGPQDERPGIGLSVRREDARAIGAALVAAAE